MDLFECLNVFWNAYMVNIFTDDSSRTFELKWIMLVMLVVSKVNKD